ncbi:abortive infection family protein [Actinomyces timonensis]|uniref:Abortive infection family protein n=1 Tax=Actinomyces timonensis TaxID=1288391 RepID=A0AAU8N027_9ACTO
MANNQYLEDVARAVAAFFHGGEGPTHREVTDVLVGVRCDDGYRYDPSAVDSPNKEQRVLRGFCSAARQGSSCDLLERFLSLLRHHGLIVSPDGELTRDAARLRDALNRDNWTLSPQGELRAMGDIDLATGGREALDETLERLRGSSDDPALAIGTAKDLLESVAKFVLEELGMGVQKGQTFNGLWHHARERLGVLPQNVDTSLAGYKEIRQIHKSLWSIAENVNALRNLQGTGHGRTLPTGVSKELAWLVVREACSVAEYMLRLLDKEQGR